MPRSPAARPATPSSRRTRRSTAKSICQGKYGYFTVGTGVVNTGADHQTAKALYFQDQLAGQRHLTLNLGIRLDTENQPPYDPTRFPSVNFGWGDKIAPRIGGAYDLLHNGKVKVYASYGQFYDIMKMGLARGSFGSDYWHNCVYALDDADFTKITPTLSVRRRLPGYRSGARRQRPLHREPGSPRHQGRSPRSGHLAGHEAHEAARVRDRRRLAGEAATGPSRSATRASASTTPSKTWRSPTTSASTSATPAAAFADVLHRPASLPCPSGTTCPNSITADGNLPEHDVPFCAECPPTVKAIRRYDGAEFRLSKRSAGKWFGSVSYTYSKLRGNYAGLTNTDPTDGTFGRHAPNNSRLFDMPTMTYLPNGKIDDGPLSTDRPHTATGYAYYRLKWAHMETDLGVTQFAFQGTPIISCLPVVGTSFGLPVGRRPRQLRAAQPRRQWRHRRRATSSTTRAPTHYIQTDLNFRHEIPFQEKYRLSFEATFANLFNQRATLAVYEFMIPANTGDPAPRLALPRRSAARLGQGDERLQLHRCPERYRRLCRHASRQQHSGSGQVDAGQPLRHAEPVPTGSQHPAGGPLHLLDPGQSPIGDRETGPLFVSCVSMLSPEFRPADAAESAAPRTPTGSKRTPAGQSRTR